MFDPYHKWLGIPPHEQPPDYYRLLGLARFEGDREVIDAAANRQMAYLQSCAGGDKVELSQRLLNEVATARLCLLKPATRAAYDATLRPTTPDALPASARHARVVDAEVIVEPPISRPRSRAIESIAVPSPPLPRSHPRADLAPIEANEAIPSAFSPRPHGGRFKRQDLWFWGQIALAGLVLTLTVGSIWAYHRPDPAEGQPTVAQPVAAREMESDTPPGPTIVAESAPKLPTPEPTVVAASSLKVAPEPTPPDQSGRTAPEMWRDLLADVDPQRDSFGDQKWSQADDDLLSPEGGAILALPGPVPRRYRLRARIRKGSDRMFGVGLVVGRNHHLITFDSYPQDGCDSKFDVVDGRGVVFHAGPRLLPLGEESTIECAVLDETVEVSINGKRVGEWRGDFARLAVHDAWKFGPKSGLFLASVDRGNTVRRVELLPLSDETSTEIAPPLSIGPVAGANSIEPADANRRGAPAPEPILLTDATDVTALICSPDGGLIITGHKDGLIGVWDRASGRWLRRIEGHNGKVMNLAITGDSKLLASCGGRDASIRLWEAASGRLIRLFHGHTRYVEWLLFTPDKGSLIASTYHSDDINVRTWDVATGSQVDQIKHCGPIALSPAGNRLFIGEWQTPLFWDRRKNSEVGRVAGHQSFVQAVAFAPKGDLAASASGWVWTKSGFMNGPEHSIRLWDTTTGKERKRLLGHQNWINCIAFTADGRRLLSGGGGEIQGINNWQRGTDFSVRLWDVATGKKLRRFDGHNAPVKHLAIAPDGTTAYSQDEDGRVRNWDLTD